VTGTLAVLAMAALTYLTRVGGLWLMAHVPLTPRIERFLDALAGAVLVALLAPIVLAGDLALQAGVALAVLVMALARSGLLAVAAGVACTALLRQLL
jgi:uncharacterized membrane protein